MADSFPGCFMCNARRDKPQILCTEDILSHRIEYTVPWIKTGDKIYCDTGCRMLRHNIKASMRVAGSPRYTVFL